MILIFWQGIISIHQKTFLEALAKNSAVRKVIMVVENDITPYRKNMGWDVPEIEGVHIIHSPSGAEITRIFAENRDAIHVLGGIRVGWMMKRALSEGAKTGAKMGAMSEPFSKNGFKGFFRKLKYEYYKVRYFRYFDFFLAIGKEGVNQFTNLGFDPHLIFPWAYFITVDHSHSFSLQARQRKRIIFAGRVEEGKGIYQFIRELSVEDKKKYTLDIYGEGAVESRIKRFVLSNGLETNVFFHSFLPYNELIKLYKNFDWVLLPSVSKEGWGVVVSEGMLNGLKAICSNICGVSWAIRENFNGVVFDWDDKQSCHDAISKMLDSNDFADSGAISNWAHEAVSAEAGAAYYLKILASVYSGADKPEIPWEIV